MGDYIYKTKENLKMKDYLVSNIYLQDRFGNYDRQKQMRDSFSPDKPNDNDFFCGNIEMNMNVTKEKKLTFQKETSFKFLEERISLCQAIPSSLLLYRLIATFNAAPYVEADPYKSIWSYHLKHNPTNIRFAFGDYKGCASFWSEFINIDDVPEDFMNGLISLVNYLLSNECAHPYDRTVAGSVA